MAKRRLSQKHVKKAPTKYRYGVLLPHELDVLLPLMKELYEGIGFKEALENPMPFLNKMKRDCFESPYVMVYACFGPGLEPLGYIWIILDRDKLGDNFMKIEQIVITKNKRKSRIAYRLIKYSTELGFRHGAKYCKIEVSTPESETMWRKLGFKSKFISMEFEGGGVEFGEANKAFKLNPIDFQEKDYARQLKTIVKAVP